MGGLGVFTDNHVNANFRTVNLMCFFFSSCRTSNWRIAVLKVFFVFDNISVNSRPLQMKLLSKLISNMLSILALKRSGKCFLTPQKQSFLDGTGCFSGTSWQCFTMFCKLQQELTRFVSMDKSLTSLKSNYIFISKVGTYYKPLKKKTFDTPPPPPHYVPCLSWQSIH